jgi:O-antigen/teichoic acid export membrane protein
MRKLVHQFLSGAAWQTIAGSISQVATLLGTAAVAKILDVTHFGVYGFLQSTLTSWALVAQASAGLIATRYVAAHRSEQPDEAGRTLAWTSLLALCGGGLAGIALAVAKDGVASDHLQGDAISIGLAVGAAILPVASLTLQQFGALAGFEAYYRTARVAVLCGPMFVGLPVIGAYFGNAVWAFVGLAFAYLIRSVLLSLALRRTTAEHSVSFQLVAWRSFVRVFWAFGVPAALTGATSAGAMWIANLLVIGGTNGAKEMALVGMAQLFRVLVTFVPSQTGTATVALLTRLRSQRGHDYGADAVVYWVGVCFSALLAMLTATALAFTAYWLLGWFGSEYQVGLRVVYTFLFAAVIESVAIAAYQSLPSAARMWQSFAFVAVPRDVMFIALGAAWIPSTQAEGFAHALVVSQTIGLLGTIYAAARLKRRDTPTRG